MTPEFEKLREAVGRVTEIERCLKNARRLPSAYANDAERVVVARCFANSYDDVPKELAAKAKAALGAVVDQERVRGEQERDRVLAALAIEIHGIRATLPGLAAKAAISLGECASDLLNPDGAV